MGNLPAQLAEEVAPKGAGRKGGTPNVRGLPGFLGPSCPIGTVTKTPGSLLEPDS